MGQRWLAATLLAGVTGCTLIAGLGAEYHSASVGTDARAPTDAAPPDTARPDAAPPTGASCREILALAPGLATGFYTLTPEAGASFEAYCEMTIDGGGWTLVGRSAPNGMGRFGWSVSTGTARDLLRPYSVDVGSAGLAFTEVMVASRVDGSYDAGPNAYKFPFRASDVAAYPNDSLSTIVIATVLGDCNPGDDSPEMLRYAGATSFTDAFFLRDIPDLGIHTGLRADRFDLTYSNCNQGGLLERAQGLLFVR